MFVMSDNKKSMRKYLLPIFAIAITGLIGSCTKSYSPTTGPYQNLQIALQTIATAEKNYYRRRNYRWHILWQ